MIFDVRGAGLTAEEFGRRTERSGVRFTVLGPTLVRAVLHLDVPADGVERALSAAPRGAAGVTSSGRTPGPAADRGGALEYRSAKTLLRAAV